MVASRALLGRFARRAKPVLLLALGKIGGNNGRGQGADANYYRGEKAKKYIEAKRMEPSWQIEQAVMAELLSTMPHGSKILDVPFGTGRFVEMYLERDMRIFGLDISEDMFAAAKEFLGEDCKKCELQVGSADALPYDDASFDLVVCFHFLGLISFNMACDVLAEIHRVTTKSAIIRVPIRRAGAPPVPAPRDNEALQGKLYEEELVALFRRFGLAVRDKRYIEDRQNGKVAINVYVVDKVPVEAQ